MKLPVVPSEKVLKVLVKHGLKKVRQKGSHVCIHKKETDKNLLAVVPLKKVLKKGTLECFDKVGLKDDFLLLCQ